jgi:hypothetical protein
MRRNDSDALDIFKKCEAAIYIGMILAAIGEKWRKIVAPILQRKISGAPVIGSSRK